MSNYFTAVLGSGSVASLYLVPVNKGDANVYMRVSGVEDFVLRPSEKIKAMIAPNSAPLASGTAINLLKQRTPKDDTTNGYFFFDGGENNTQQNDSLSYSDLRVPRNWENTSFDLYWYHTLDTIEDYGSYQSGVYSYPHNLQPGDITISGSLVSANTMEYRLILDEIANDDDANYGATPNDGPYAVKVEYKWPEGTNASGFSDYIYYDDSVLSSGIVFNLPYYDPRDAYNNAPAIYNFKVVYTSAGSDKPGSNPLTITLNHATLLDSSKYFQNLDEFVFTKADKDQLRRVDEVEIPPNIIDRKRMSIGINDIAIKDNTYVKKGSYVSPFYPVDFDMYTFSFRVKENIPNYGDINPYDLVKYYAEFNNNTWEPISPLERKEEYRNGILIPKMFVFDAANSDTNGNVKFLNYGSNITSFRIKITFDLSSIGSEKFPPPEIMDYDCIIFDKSQFLNL